MKTKNIEASDLQKRLAKEGYADELFGDLDNQRSDGQNDVKADCPFCEGNDFSYSTAEPLFRCWNCGKKGDWIDYVQMKKDLDFQQALHHLAQMGGIELEDVEVSQEYREKRRAWELFDEVFSYTQRMLFESEGKKVLDYLKQRGYRVEEIRDMGLGACSDRETLVNHLKHDGFTQEELSDNGIFTGGNNRGFGITHELIIPWQDRYGKALALAGRIVDHESNSDTPKYLISSGLERSGTFIGLDQTGNSSELILVEGLLDALYLNSHGFAAIGKGGNDDLSDKQEELLSEIDPNQLIVAYDDDEAGKEGTQKVVRQLQDSDFRTYVATFDGHKDPDELVRQEGPESFQRCVDKSTRAPKWLGSYLVDRHDLSTDRGRDQTISRALEASSDLTGMAKQDFDQVLSSSLGERYEKRAKRERKKQRREKLERAKESTIEKLEQMDEPDPEQLRQVLSESLENVNEEDTDRIEHYRMEDFLEDIRDGQPGLETGIDALDERINLPQGALTIIAGRSGHGKTTFMLNMLLNMIEEYPDREFGYFSYEESRDRLTTKLLMSHAGVELSESYEGVTNFDRYRNYLKGDRDNEKIEGALKDLGNYMEDRRLSLVSEPLTVDELSSAIHRVADNRGQLGAIFVDYLQKVETSTNSDTRYLQIARVTERLRRSSTELDVPIICGAQLNRGAERENDLKMSHLREGGDIEKDANLIIALEKDGHRLDLELLKNREGSMENLPSLDFQGSILRISSGDNNDLY